MMILTKLLYNRRKRKLLPRLKECQLLVFDFDGVFTDNNVYINERGEEMVCCNRSDTFGLKSLKSLDVKVKIMSTEKVGIVLLRGKKIEIDVLHDIADKGQTLREEMTKNNVSSDQVVFVGNDVNDILAFKVAGVRIAVADSWPGIFPYVDFITEKSGGKGAVREVINLILEAKKSSH